MTDPAAIAANLVDVKNIATHRCVLLSIHVPQEQANLVLKAFGWPTMANPVPVAIAALDLSNAAQKPVQAPAKPKQKWDEMPYNQQAAIRCSDLGFLQFLATYENDTGIKIISGDAAADRVRTFCSVASRSEIVKGSRSGNKWEALEREYQNWLATQQHGPYVR